MSSIQYILSNKNVNTTTDVFNNLGINKNVQLSPDVDAIIGFFVKRKFSRLSAESVAAVLMDQLKNEDKLAFDLLNELENYDSVKLNSTVAVILNNARSNITTIGFRATATKSKEYRNIITRNNII
tara:strand:+ start:238 stop:615 length:378 start_codon:yes stop_codon:yes gene_type:complete